MRHTALFESESLMFDLCHRSVDDPRFFLLHVMFL